jgi:hypothetical protein
MQTKTRNRNPVVGKQSFLTKGESHADPKMVELYNNMRQGSKELCAAILNTGKLYRKMTPEEQLDARLYAFGPELTDKRKRK